MYDYEYTKGLGATSSSTQLADVGIWGIIALVIAIIGGICLYFTVFSKANEKKYAGFMAKLYEYVKFDKMIITSFLKITYLIGAIYITLASFGLISTSFLIFLVTLVLGNLILRVVYEFMLVTLKIFENTNEINKKMK